MFNPIAALSYLFHRSSSKPSVAAAVVVLGNPPDAPVVPRLAEPLRAVAPHLSDAELAGWVNVLAGRLAKAGITEPRCVAAFLGQCAVESAGFRRLEEDLNYTASRLCQVWPSRFPNPETAASCALQPEILAGRVYANRLGNGNEASGDGWRFRGRGLMQITGRTNYELFANAMRMTLGQAVDHAATPDGAADSAIWFWTANQLNALANAWSIDLLNEKISGGTTGAADRSRLCQTALQAIGA